MSQDDTPNDHNRDTHTQQTDTQGTTPPSAHEKDSISSLKSAQTRDFHASPSSKKHTWLCYATPFAGGVLALGGILALINGVLWYTHAHPLQRIDRLQEHVDALNQDHKTFQTRIESLETSLSELSQKTYALASTQQISPPPTTRDTEGDIIEKIAPLFEGLLKNSLGAITEPLSRKLSEVKQSTTSIDHAQLSPLMGLVCLDHMRRLIEQGKPYAHVYTILVRSIKSTLNSQQSITPQVLNAMRYLSRYQSTPVPTLASLMKLPRHEDVLFEHLPNGFVWMKSYIQTSHDLLSPHHRDVLATHLTHGDLKGAIEFVKRHITDNNERGDDTSNDRDQNLAHMWDKWLTHAEGLQTLYDALETMETFLLSLLDEPKTVSSDASPVDIETHDTSADTTDSSEPTTENVSVDESTTDNASIDEPASDESASGDHKDDEEDNA